MAVTANVPASVSWAGEAADGWVDLLDQTLLPKRHERLALRDLEAVAEAIVSLRVRGAPAIGICAAYGVVVHAASHLRLTRDAAALVAAVHEACDRLARTRPTAVNLFYALGQMRAAATTPGAPADAAELLAHLLRRARELHEEDRLCCEAIGRHGLSLLPDGVGVLTHCNAGALATGGIGTATAPLYTAHSVGRAVRVYCDETRPVFQGARLTAWELTRSGLDATLICDNMAAAAMRAGKVGLVIVGADRITANGDVANKIGTYGLAVLAKHHGIPFYVAAPTTTIDLSLPTGDSVVIEQRVPAEVTHAHGHPVAEPSQAVWNPAFDVTPAELVSAIVTQRGIARAPYEHSLRAACAAEPAGLA